MHRHTLCMQPENELVALAQSGDRRAFEQLVERNSGRIYSVAYRILNNQQTAEDCVQETFLKVYLKIDSFKLQSKFSTWIYSIGTNVALDMLRKRRKQTDSDPGDLDRFAGQDANTTEQQAMSSNLHDAVKHAINSLNDDVRVAFVLRHYQGCSIDEITQILNINASTAKSRIFRAVGRLRQLLHLKVDDYDTVD